MPRPPTPDFDALTYPRAHKRIIAYLNYFSELTTKNPTQIPPQTLDSFAKRLHGLRHWALYARTTNHDYLATLADRLISLSNEALNLRTHVNQIIRYVPTITPEDAAKKYTKAYRSIVNMVRAFPGRISISVEYHRPVLDILIPRYTLHGIRLGPYTFRIKHNNPSNRLGYECSLSLHDPANLSKHGGLWTNHSIVATPEAVGPHIFHIGLCLGDASAYINAGLASLDYCMVVDSIDALFSTYVPYDAYHRLTFWNIPGRPTVRNATRYNPDPSREDWLAPRPPSGYTLPPTRGPLNPNDYSPEIPLGTWVTSNERLPTYRLDTHFQPFAMPFLMQPLPVPPPPLSIHYANNTIYFSERSYLPRPAPSPLLLYYQPIHLPQPPIATAYHGYDLGFTCDLCERTLPHTDATPENPHICEDCFAVTRNQGDFAPANPPRVPLEEFAGFPAALDRCLNHNECTLNCSHCNSGPIRPAAANGFLRREVHATSLTPVYYCRRHFNHREHTLSRFFRISNGCVCPYPGSDYNSSAARPEVSPPTYLGLQHEEILPAPPAGATPNIVYVDENYDTHTTALPALTREALDAMLNAVVPPRIFTPTDNPPADPHPVF